MVNGDTYTRTRDMGYNSGGNPEFDPLGVAIFYSNILLVKYSIATTRRS
jgi:hypothetical protein